LKFAKDSEDYMAGTEINHSEFYGYVEFEETDYSKPVYVNTTYENCDEGNCTSVTETRTTYPYKKIGEGISMSSELALLRQQIFEIKECTALSDNFNKYQECITAA